MNVQRGHYGVSDIHGSESLYALQQLVCQSGKETTYSSIINALKYWYIQLKISGEESVFDLRSYTEYIKTHVVNQEDIIIQ